MANREKFPAAVEREIARRAVNTIGEKCCEKCGAVGVPLELHHLEMDALVSAERKAERKAKKQRLTAADGAMWCKGGCHKEETKRQRGVLAKVEAVEKKFWLPRKEATMRSGNTLPEAKPKRRATTPPTKIAAGLSAFARRMGITEDA